LAKIDAGSCTDPADRRNLVSATWHCVTGVFADGDPAGISEGTCASNPVSNSADASVEPSVSANASIAASSIDYCDKTKEVTITITNGATSNTLYDLNAVITLPTSNGTIKFNPALPGTTVFNVTASPAGNVTDPNITAVIPNGATTYDFYNDSLPHKYLVSSMAKNTSITIKFDVSSYCFSAGDISLQYSYKDCCGNTYTPAVVKQTITPDNPNLGINIIRDKLTPIKGDTVNYVITVTNPALAANATYAQIKAKLGKWLKFQSATDPNLTIIAPAVSSTEKCDDDGDVSTGVCSTTIGCGVGYTNGYLMWDLQNLPAGRTWTSTVTVIFDPPAGNTDCNDTYSNLEVSTLFDCPDNISGAWFDSPADACKNETGPGCGTTKSNTEINGFGFCPRLGDYVWFDTNKDGKQDVGEKGIPNVTVKLLDASNNVVATTTTDATGHYLFTKIPIGVYKVEVDTTTLPAGLTLI